MAKAKIAIISGTGFENSLAGMKSVQAKTPYGLVQSLSVCSVDGAEIAFLQRHGLEHSVPPHRINYRANIYALHEMGVERILATNAVGAINDRFIACDVVIPHDFVDFTKVRCTTFYDDAPVTHVDVTQPYCPEIRDLLVENAKKAGLHVWDQAVLACTEGPRYETPAEIEMLRRLGCDVVGMTGFPEVVLARELEMCYASICYVSNKAAGMQQRLTASEMSKIADRVLPMLKGVLIETANDLLLARRRDCRCADALSEARFG